MRRNFDVIPIDIWDIDDIIDTDGTEQSERELALKYQTNFTPSLVFYDADGTPVFRLRGYYPPYKFRAALKYVAEKFYENETFSEYFARASQGEFFLLGGLLLGQLVVEQIDETRLELLFLFARPAHARLRAGTGSAALGRSSTFWMVKVIVADDCNQLAEAMAAVEMRTPPERPRPDMDAITIWMET